LILVAAFALAAGDANAATPLFRCSFGSKAVEVSVSGPALVYRYGSPRRTEIRLDRPLVGVDVGHHYQILAHAEHRHLRVANGRYSYILYDRFSAPAYDGSGAEDAQGLLVLRDGRVIARHACRTGPGFAKDFRFERLRRDEDDLAALAAPPEDR
jgi:hypothetical protein